MSGTRILTDNHDRKNDVITTTYKNGVFLSSSTSNVRYYADNFLAYGFDLPRFHERRRSGELLPLTPWDYAALIGSVTQSNWDEYYQSGSTTYRYVKSGKFGFDDNLWMTKTELHERFSSYMTDKYVSEAAAQIYSEGYDALTFLAELASTKRLFLEAGQGILKLLRQANMLNIDLTKVPGKWLAYRYGWRTLMYDIRDISEMIKNLGEENPRKRYSKRSGNDVTFTEVQSFSSTPYTGRTDLRTWTDTVTIGRRGHVVADISVPELQFNPLITGWELIPFSFVIDWFLRVGVWLSSLSFLWLNDKYVAAKSLMIKVKRDFTYMASLTSPRSGSISSSGSAVCTCLIRVPCKIPVLPRINVKFDWRKVLDIIALIIQRR